MCILRVQSCQLVCLSLHSIPDTREHETRQGKATTPENCYFCQEEKEAASGGTRTRNILHAVQMLYQLSHRGSSAGQAESLKVMQVQRYLSPVVISKQKCF